jgi:hypothetical protein
LVLLGKTKGVIFPPGLVLLGKTKGVIFPPGLVLLGKTKGGFSYNIAPYIRCNGLQVY